MDDYYEVVSGSHSRDENGKRVRYQPGDGFAPTQQELAAFGDKLRPARKLWGGVDLPAAEGPEVLADPVGFDVAAHSVVEVLGAVEAGTITAANALDGELAGKRRKSLISALEDQVEDGNAG